MSSYTSHHIDRPRLARRSVPEMAQPVVVKNAPLPKPRKSQAWIDEKIAALRHRGFSEEQAVAKALTQAGVVRALQAARSGEG